MRPFVPYLWGMKHRIAPVFATLALALVLATPLSAATKAELDALYDAMRTDELLEVMANEGLAEGEGLQEDMLGGRGGVAWDQILTRIYTPATMAKDFRAVFDAEMADADVGPLLDFYATDAGQRVVQFEVEGRRAIGEDAVEQAAKTAYIQLAPEGARLKLLTEFLELNDLVELNVAGAMTSNLAFFRGMGEGGGFEMDESEMLAQVYASEPEIRADTTEWVTAYLTFTYARLSDDELSRYIALSKTKAGRDLNRALFAGFYDVFTGISFDLGEAVSRFMVTEEL